MIFISRPVTQTHKPVTNIDKRSLNSNLNKEENLVDKIKDQRDQKDKMDNRVENKREALEKAVKDTNKLLFDKNDRFEFKVHEGTNRMMVKLIDNDTDEIIKEFPPEKILDLVASIWDLVGILVDTRG